MNIFEVEVLCDDGEVEYICLTLPSTLSDHEVEAAAMQEARERMHRPVEASIIFNQR